MPTFVDLFCGAGGLSLGLAAAGWRPVLAVDAWEDAVETYRNHFSDHPVLLSDVSKITGKLLRSAIGETPDWIVGGPPCQGFSTVGRRIRSDERNLLIQQFVRVVEEVGPKGILVENVLGLRDMDFVELIVKLFRRIGYRVTPLVLKAAEYGVPQLRHRIVFVGMRDGEAFAAPQPRHQTGQYVSVWDAIGDLPELSAGEAAESYDRPPSTEFQNRMRRDSRFLQGHVASKHPPYLVEAISYIPDGGSRRSIPDRLQPQSGYHNSYSRLSSNAPAVAVTQNMGKPSGTRCIHPFQHRGLTAREGARLQSFPDTFHFLGGVTSQRLQIANAVPPLLAERLAVEIAEANPETRGKSVRRLQLA